MVVLGRGELGKLFVLRLALGIFMIPVKRILAEPTGFVGRWMSCSGGSNTRRNHAKGKLAPLLHMRQDLRTGGKTFVFFFCFAT